MALSEPLDFLSEFPGWTPQFDIVRRQEQSTTAGGRILNKDLGPPLWEMSARSKDLSANELDHWRARLDALEDGQVTFIGYSLSRTYPIAYPRGSWPTGNAFSGESASLYSVAVNRKAIRVAELPQGFSFSIGDMLQVGNDLHRVMEPATADAFGLTSEFEVRPHIWPGVDGSESPPFAVSVKRPHCIMGIVPGSIATAADPRTGRGSVAFRAREAR